MKTQKSCTSLNFKAFEVLSVLAMQGPYLHDRNCAKFSRLSSTIDQKAAIARRECSEEGNKAP